jgi:hypothetical protein
VAGRHRDRRLLDATAKLHDCIQLTSSLPPHFSQFIEKQLLKGRVAA